jgi:hypothetical protein
MKNPMFRAAMLAALIASGCQAPDGLTTVPVEGGAAVANVTGPVATVSYALRPAGRYAVAAVEDETAESPTPDAKIAVKAVGATSTRNAYFPARYLVDGNVHSAWAPGAEDDAPAITLDLGGAYRLSAIAIKLSAADVTVDVAVGGADEGWTTVATDLAPEPTTLSDLELAACQGERVRLTFHGVDVADLLVCEVEARGTKATAPTPAPSASPAATPTPTGEACLPCEPTPPPVVDHDDDEDCRIEAGGWMKKGKHKHKEQVAFACDVDRHGRGTIVVHDVVTKVKRVGRCETIRRHGNVTMMEGTLEGGGRFRCTVVDGRRHGKPATWSFTCEDGLMVASKLGLFD